MIVTNLAKAARAATLAACGAVLAVSLATGTAEAANNGPLYGDPTAAAPYWRHQTLDDCAIMSAADVVGQLTGHEPSEHAIVKVAQKTPSKTHSGSIYIPPADKDNPNSGEGTNARDLPELLAHYGVNAKWTDKQYAAQTGVATGLEALEQQLGAGHKVIVILNAETIWGKPAKKLHDGNLPGDHAVVVTGVDTAAGIVHLNDSGPETGRDEQVRIDVFMTAWAAEDEVGSEQEMIVTA